MKCRERDKIKTPVKDITSVSKTNYQTKPKVYSGKSITHTSTGEKFVGDMTEEEIDQDNQTRYWKSIEEVWRTSMTRKYIKYLQQERKTSFAKEVEQRKKRDRQVRLLDKLKHTKDINKQQAIKRVIREIENPTRITKEQIETAKLYPIESLVVVNKQHFANCIAHTDTHPSMYCKGNYAHCFTCGYSGDVIDVAMRTWHTDFAKTINNLTNTNICTT